jgi:hypothetical protein
MEHEEADDHLKLSQDLSKDLSHGEANSASNNSNKLELERQSSSVSFSTQNFNNTDFKKQIGGACQ